MQRIVYGSLGLFSAGLGVLGAFLPVMPSTCFFILAVYFFSKSSVRLENWVLNHPRFGTPVRAWRTHGAVSVSSKLAAVLGMSVGLIFVLLSPASLPVILASSIFILLSAVYVLSRPTLDAQKMALIVPSARVGESAVRSK